MQYLRDCVASFLVGWRDASDDVISASDIFNSIGMPLMLPFHNENVLTVCRGLSSIHGEARMSFPRTGGPWTIEAGNDRLSVALSSDLDASMSLHADSDDVPFTFLGPKPFGTSRWALDLTFPGCYKFSTKVGPVSSVIGWEAADDEGSAEIATVFPFFHGMTTAAGAATTFSASQGEDQVVVLTAGVQTDPTSCSNLWALAAKYTIFPFNRPQKQLRQGSAPANRNGAPTLWAIAAGTHLGYDEEGWTAGVVLQHDVQHETVLHASWESAVAQLPLGLSLGISTAGDIGAKLDARVGGVSLGLAVGRDPVGGKRPLFGIVVGL